MGKISSKPFVVQIRPNIPNTKIPSWVPPEGHYANISLNTMLDARPEGWPNSDVAGPFANWSGAAYASGFSNLGAYVTHGSGHLSAGAALWAGVWCFDLDTLKWVGRNVPSEPLLEASPKVQFNEYGEVVAPASIAGHTYPPHTYDGLAYQSPSLGGGVHGSLLRFFIAGSTMRSAVHSFNLSSPTAPPKRIIDQYPMRNNYPATAVDEARGGVWVLSGNGNGPLSFLRFSDMTVTTFQNADYNDYGNHQLIYIPAPYDCLVGLGNTGSGGPDLGIWVCPISNGVPQGFSRVKFAGTSPADKRCGGVWSTILKCIVTYEGGGTQKVLRLQPPPPSEVRTATWNWTTETLAGVNGVAPSKNATANNGTWGRFLEVPAARCFIFCDGVGQPVQAWRLTGMG